MQPLAELAGNNGMTSIRRIERLQIKIREELGKIIIKEFDFAFGTLVTITRVELSEDLTAVRIYISVMPERNEQDVLTEMNKEIYVVQQKFNKKMEMRPVPRIRFLLDETVREAAKIEENLYNLKNKDK